MAKHVVKEVVQEHIITTPLEDIMGDRFGRYSKYIIQDRALPDARDGLKPVQRRILYAMFHDGNTADKGYRKSAKTVGLVIGNYHPHGDSSVYDAMVRMSQQWKIREPLIDMQGNNGSIDDDPAAAMRYTEAKLGKIAAYLLEDIDKDTVEWALNFDDTELEPTVLPANYPHLLINGISGIAAGYATNIPPHNLNETLDATIYRIQNRNCDLEELMEYIQGPDFPTGGTVQGIEGIKEAFRTGKGRVMVRSKSEISETRTNQQIIITEIPYEVIKSNLVKKMDDIRLTKRIDGILDVRDESDRNGLRIAIDIKKDVDAQFILNYLYKNTDLQVSYNYNVVAIVRKRPEQMGLCAMLDAFIDHRYVVISRRSRFDLNKKEKRCHILEGLMKAISVLDEIIAMIRASKNKADSKANIMERFGFSDEQAEAIVTMQLYRLSSTDITQLKEEHALLLNEIETLNDILSDDHILHSLMIKELKAVKAAFPTPRLTRIEHEIEEIVIEKEQMITQEQVMVTLSRDGYAKRVSMRSFGASEHLRTALKEGDELIGQVEVNTLDQLLFFTTRGTYGYLPVYELEEAKWKDIGSHVNNLMKMSSDEKMRDAFAIRDFNTYGYIVTISKLGMIKKTAIADFKVSRNNKTMSAMTLSDEDEMVGAFLAYDGDEVLLASRHGYISRYPISLVPATAPKSKGVKAMNLMEDEITSATVYASSGSFLIVGTNQHAFKRVKLSEITMTNRPAKGNMICKKVKSNPYAISDIRIGDLNDEIHFMNAELHAYKVKDFTLMSRESTFSAPIDIDKECYVLKGIRMIEKKEAPIVEEVDEMKYEEINLELD